MFSRYWRDQLALGWLAPFAILVGFAAAHLISGGDLLYCNQADARGGNAATEPKQVSVPEAFNDKQDCRDKRAQRDDKCQSWRQAEAAEDQACVTRRQFYAGTFIGLLGLLGLIGTVIFTKQAADGALRAARAAQDSAITADRTLRQMQDTTKRELRAYLAAIPYRLTGLVPTDQPCVRFRITNHGVTPARSMNNAAVLRIEQHPLPDNYPFPPLPAPDERPNRCVLHRDSAVPNIGSYTQFASFTAAQIIEILKSHEPGKGRRLYVFGQVDYVDAFQTPRWTRFCCSFVGPRRLLVAAQDNQWGTVATDLNKIEEGLFEVAAQHNETDQD